MGSERRSLKIVALYTCGAILTLPLAYYTVQEASRARTLRRRKKRYAARMQQIDARRAKDEHVDSKEELDAATELFASLSVLGRYQNPFAEWHEEGAWQWFFWQLIYKPMTGRFLWDGGCDEEERKRVLPSQRPDFRKIYGVDPEARDRGKLDDLTHFDDLIPKAADNIEEVEGREPETRKAPASPDSWESLSASREISVTRDFTCTWFGQSTCLITLDGCCILTDPIWAMRLVEWTGPERQRPPPAPLADLLRVDVVLVSHDHYDHLDIAVVDYLGDSCQWLVPLGLAWLFRSRGITRVTELDWWQSVTIKAPAELKVTYIPSMHWSARTPFTTNQSLWGSFVVQGKQDSIFHCGDTGLVPSLSEQIGRHFGPISLALLPIGAYQPRWHLAPQHMDPECAVRMHKLLRAKKTIGYHWGTFNLSDDRYDDPPRDLAIARDLHHVDVEQVFTLHLGQTIVLAQ